jgi:hypothetical protein
VTVGSSGGSQTKMLTVPAGFICPRAITKENWRNSDTYDDRFVVIQSSLVSSSDVTIGSGSGTKTVTGPSGFVCPTSINKDVWRNPETFDDRFTLTQSGATLTVQRVGDSSWGLNLVIQCYALSQTAHPTWLHVRRTDSANSGWYQNTRMLGSQESSFVCIQTLVCISMHAHSL